MTDARRNTEVLHGPFAESPGVEDGDLDRIDPDMIFGKPLEAMPFVARLQRPVGRIAARL